MDLFEALRASYLTEGMTDDDVRGLVGLCEFVEKEDLQDIVHTNEVSFDLYVLLEGHMEVTTEGGDIISRLKPGAIIGEFAFFEDGVRGATVMSLGHTKLLHLNGAKLLQHIDSHPSVGMALYRSLGRTLCDRLRSANIQIERLVSSL